MKRKEKKLDRKGGSYKEMKWEKRKEKELDRKRRSVEGYEVGDNEKKDRYKEPK